MAVIKRQIVTSAGEDMENRNPYTMLEGTQNGIDTLLNTLAVSQKCKLNVTI